MRKMIVIMLGLSMLATASVSAQEKEDETDDKLSILNFEQSTETMSPDPFNTTLPEASTYVPESDNASATANSFPEKELEEAVKESGK